MKKDEDNGLTTVDLLVSLQEVLLDETHAALAALERSLAWKQTHQRVQARTFHSLLLNTFFWFVNCGVTSVDKDVSAEVVGASEGRRAVLANVRLVSW